MGKIIKFPDKETKQIIKRTKAREKRQKTLKGFFLWLGKMLIWLFFVLRFIIAQLAEFGLTRIFYLMHWFRYIAMILGGFYCLINYYKNGKIWITPHDKSTVVVLCLILVCLFGQALGDVIYTSRIFQRLFFICSKPQPQQKFQQNTDNYDEKNR